jgi:hypothetical protein
MFHSEGNHSLARLQRTATLKSGSFMARIGGSRCAIAF